MKEIILLAIVVVCVSGQDDSPDEALRCQYIPADFKYLFYSPKNPDTPIIINSDNTADIKNTHFDPSIYTMFLVHGSGGNSSGPLVQTIKSTVAKAKINVNVIGLDWRQFQLRNKEINVYNCTELFGLLVGNFLNVLVKDYGLQYTRMTMVGHSIAGKFMSALGLHLNGKINSIIGLETCAISRSSAKFVECLYTGRANGSPNGHANFYPNGGTNQSHCPPPPDWRCNHWRVIDYYAESLTTDKFVAKQCKTYEDYNAGKCNSHSSGIMGRVEPDHKLSGKYYLYTNPDPPYAMG